MLCFVFHLGYSYVGEFEEQILELTLNVFVFLFLQLVVGFLTKREYRGIDGDIPSIGDSEDHDNAGNNCYWAAFIYGIFFAISIARLVHLWVIGRKSRHQHMDEFAS